MPMNRNNAGRGFRTDFLFLTESMGTACYADCGFSFEWILDGGGCRITGEWLTLKEERSGQKPERIILRGEGEALCRARKEERCGTGINAGDDGLVTGRCSGTGFTVGSFSAGWAPSGFLRSGTRILHGCSPQLSRESQTAMLLS